NRILDLPSDDQVERCLDLLARMSAYDEATAKVTATAIGAGHGQLVDRAEAQSQPRLGHPGRLALAGALQRLLTPQFCRVISHALAGADPADSARLRELAATYRRLGDLAVDGDRSADAETLHRQSLALEQELADADPADSARPRDLAATYRRLGD